MVPRLRCHHRLRSKNPGRRVWVPVIQREIRPADVDPKSVPRLKPGCHGPQIHPDFVNHPGLHQFRPEQRIPVPAPKDPTRNVLRKTF